MKRILSILLTLLICSAAVFAADYDEGDEYDDGLVYESNGSGDQFIKISIGAFFPLNFGDSLYIGGVANLGYYRFINSLIAVGGEIDASYNVSIGKKILVTLPMTAGVLIQPVAGRFEFPIYLTAGIGYQSWQSLNYFPSFAAKASAGCYFRLNESCSFGLSGTAYYLPEWFIDSSKSKNALFASATIGARYHF